MQMSVIFQYNATQYIIAFVDRSNKARKANNLLELKKNGFWKYLVLEPHQKRYRLYFSNRKKNCFSSNAMLLFYLLVFSSSAHLGRCVVDFSDDKRLESFLAENARKLVDGGRPSLIGEKKNKTTSEFENFEKWASRGRISLVDVITNKTTNERRNEDTINIMARKADYPWTNSKNSTEPDLNDYEGPMSLKHRKYLHSDAKMNTNNMFGKVIGKLFIAN